MSSFQVSLAGLVGDAFNGTLWFLAGWLSLAGILLTLVGIFYLIAGHRLHKCLVIGIILLVLFGVSPAVELFHLNLPLLGTPD
jgi:hypothetical protein